MSRSALRHKPTVLISVVLALLVTGHAFAQTGPIQPAAKPTLHLFTIGISQFAKPGNDLQWADQDAVSEQDFWVSHYDLLGAKLALRQLLNRQATTANIKREMQAIQEQSRSGDKVVAAWSSHGRKPSPNREWMFCTSDGDIGVSELRLWVRSLTEKGVRVILILDACFAGAFETPIPNAIVMASCQADQTSSDGDPLALQGNGLFTRVLLEGLGGKADLNGDKIVTLEEVKGYVYQNMPRDQWPMFFYTSDTPLNLPLALVNSTTTISSGLITSPTR